MDNYHKNILDNAHIEVKYFMPLIKAAMQGKEAEKNEPILVEGIDYALRIEPSVKISKRDKITLTLKWKDGAEEHTQNIAIKRGESHLVGGTYNYYFDTTGSSKHKKLFYIQYGFKGSDEFEHTYKTQGRSHNQRKIAIPENPYRKNGKRIYNGKFTPYGKRCVKYEVARLEALKALYKEVTKTQETTLEMMKGMLKVLDKKQSQKG